MDDETRLGEVDAPVADAFLGAPSIGETDPGSVTQATAAAVSSPRHAVMARLPCPSRAPSQPPRQASQAEPPSRPAAAGARLESRERSFLGRLLRTLPGRRRWSRDSDLPNKSEGLARRHFERATIGLTTPHLLLAAGFGGLVGLAAAWGVRTAWLDSRPVFGAPTQTEATPARTAPRGVAGAPPRSTSRPRPAPVVSASADPRLPGESQLGPPLPAMARSQERPDRDWQAEAAAARLLASGDCQQARKAYVALRPRERVHGLIVDRLAEDCPLGLVQGGRDDEP